MGNVFGTEGPGTDRESLSDTESDDGSVTHSEIIADTSPVAVPRVTGTDRGENVIIGAHLRGPSDTSSLAAVLKTMCADPLLAEDRSHSGVDSGSVRTFHRWISTHFVHDMTGITLPVNKFRLSRRQPHMFRLRQRLT